MPLVGPSGDFPSLGGKPEQPSGQGMAWGRGRGGPPPQAYQPPPHAGK